MVTTFVNPLQKWGDSPLMQKVPIESDKWALPIINTTIKGVKWNVFEYIIKLMIDHTPNVWEKGYIDLDKLYQETEIGIIKKQREGKLAKYKQVFKGRYAYMMRFDASTKEEEIEITDEKGKHKEKLKLEIIGGRKEYAYSYSLMGHLILFDNKELKELLKSTGAKKPNEIWVEASQAYVLVPDEIMEQESDKWDSHGLFFFINKVLYHEIFDEYLEFFKENPDKNSVFGIMIGNKIQQNSYEKAGVVKKNVKFQCDYGQLLTA